MTKAERANLLRSRFRAVGGIPYVGILKIGKDVEIDCAVLEDGTRVLSRAGFVRAIGRTGKVKGGAEYEPESKLPVFLGADNLKPFVDNDLSSNSNPIFFKAAHI